MYCIGQILWDLVEHKPVVYCGHILHDQSNPPSAFKESACDLRYYDDSGCFYTLGDSFSERFDKNERIVPISLIGGSSYLGHVVEVLKTENLLTGVLLPEKAPTAQLTAFLYDLFNTALAKIRCDRIIEMDDTAWFV